jgi:hypothetical protein
MASPDLPARYLASERVVIIVVARFAASRQIMQVSGQYIPVVKSLWLSGEVQKPSPLVAALPVTSRDPWRSACKWLILCASSSHLGSLPHQLHTRSSPNVTLNLILDCCKSTGLEYWSRPQPPTMPEPILRRNQRLRTWR